MARSRTASTSTAHTAMCCSWSRAATLLGPARAASPSGQSAASPTISRSPTTAATTPTTACCHPAWPAAPAAKQHTEAFLNNIGEMCSTQGNNAMVTYRYGNGGHPTMPACFGGTFISESPTTVAGNVGGNQPSTKRACVFYQRRCPFPHSTADCAVCYNTTLCSSVWKCCAHSTCTH